MSRDIQTILDVDGMSCGSCVRHINEALGELEGVQGVDVKLREGKVVVRHDAEVAPVSRLLKSLEDAGYEGRAGA
jgi:copper chaperone